MGKKILITAATSIEIKPFLNKLRTRKGLFSGHWCDVLVSGIGLSATTYHLTCQVKLKKYDMVIQAGVAGCFDYHAGLGDVFVLDQDTIADQSVVEMDTLKTLFGLEQLPHNQKPYTLGWLVNPHTELIRNTELPIVKGISVNEISTTENKIRYYRDLFHPVTESMEGAALHYICLMEKIPFLQIRSISNYIGERNRKKWNLKDAIDNLNKALISTISNYQ